MQITFPKRPYRTSGGVKVKHHKNTAANASKVMPSPARIVLPMQQHIGAICQIQVKKGDHVYAGQIVGDSEAHVSAPIHSSISGTVSMLTRVMLTGGQMVDAVVIDSDGKMEFDPSIRPLTEVDTTEEFVEAVRNSGLIGLGGAGFPTHVKLVPPKGSEIDTLIINAAECEPYVTADHREALENTDNVICGIMRVQKLLEIPRAIIAVEDNKPDAIRRLKETIQAYHPESESIRVLTLKSMYPQGAEKVLIRACTGRSVPEGKLPADAGCVVTNIASVSFMDSYLRTGKPLTMKRVTVDGSAVENPQNVIAPIGTRICDIIEFCGGYSREAKKILMGGPMMGISVTSDELPIIKQNNAILAFEEQDAVLPKTTACIRCGTCVSVCPMHLMPERLEKAVEKNNIELLQDLHINTCMECGSCAYGCPAGRRLVQAIRLGKNYVRKAGAPK